ncbi:hypothetical protein [Tahibacter amnicola]|uniref:Uncharacterized protein n=1 Tax=Tahibacter amnicola TaxID=2976241 RepID=A0ABY6BEE7_9GAMM|nr:hypothetical protein [Tahibacter amnicola]UXI68404.1 hypothetical protein N4264_01755 [Tahibacter amnicola]
MRFVWLVVSVLAFIFCYAASTPGLLAIGLLVGFGSMFCAVLAFAAARIESTSRPDSALLTPEVLAEATERAKRQRAAAQPVPVARPVIPQQPREQP